MGPDRRLCLPCASAQSGFWTTVHVQDALQHPPDDDAIVPALRRTARTPRSGQDAAAERTKEKGRMLRTSSLVLSVFSRPWSRDHIPTPPRAMTKLFDASLC